jgi:hypothetical protein
MCSLNTYIEANVDIFYQNGVIDMSEFEEQVVLAAKNDPLYGYQGRIDDIFKKEYAHLGGSKPLVPNKILSSPADSRHHLLGPCWCHAVSDLNCTRALP